MTFFLAIEGADGAGKATVSAAVAERLAVDGLAAAVVSFPRYGDTVGGYALGEFLAGRLPRATSPEAAGVLYALDRFESRAHLHSLAAAHDVLVFDRYVASNMAYQAAQVPASEAAATMAWIWQLETRSFGLRPPDLSVYLDTPAALARRFIAQKAQRSYTDRTFDDYEADDGLQARVRANYAALAGGRDYGRWRTVETVGGTAPRAPADIADEVVAAYLAAR